LCRRARIPGAIAFVDPHTVLYGSRPAEGATSTRAAPSASGLALRARSSGLPRASAARHASRKRIGRARA
jgi:hypothetical protein